MLCRAFSKSACVVQNESWQHKNNQTFESGYHMVKCAKLYLLLTWVYCINLVDVFLNSKTHCPASCPQKMSLTDTKKFKKPNAKFKKGLHLVSSTNIRIKNCLLDY